MNFIQNVFRKTMRVTAYAMIALCLMSHSAWAQDVKKKLPTRATTLLFEEGWSVRTVGLSYRWLDAATPKAIGLRVYGIRSARERTVKPSEVYSQPGRRFVFGKSSRLLALSPYLEVAKPIIPSGGDQLLSLQLFAQGGPILGLKRPYYVDIFVPSGTVGQGQSIQGRNVAQPFDPAIHTYTDITGRTTDPLVGLDEMNIVGGASLRLGARIGLSRRPQYLTEVVCSVQGDYLFSPIQIMALDTRRSWFPNVSIGLIVGSTWRKNNK